MSNKEDNFKEQFKQALISTAKVISEDYKLDAKKIDKDLNSKQINFLDYLQPLIQLAWETQQDYITARNK